MEANLVINLDRLPTCRCGGDMAPVQDTTQSGTHYLKGWICLSCLTSVIFKAGQFEIRKNGEQRS